MPIPVQAVYRDVPGALPAEYDAPASLDVEFASSRIRFDGSGASGDFVLALEALTNDGRVMVAARTDQVFAAGDTGVVSWAPFLRRSLPRIITQTFIGCRIENHAGQTVANNTNTDRHFNTVVFDTDNMVDLGSDDRTITINKAGIYLILAQANFAINAVERRICQIVYNGYYAAGTGTVIGNFSIQAVTSAFGRTAVPAAALYQLAVGDFISGGLYQQSGGNLVEGGAGATTTSFLSAARIGD